MDEVEISVEHICTDVILTYIYAAIQQSLSTHWRGSNVFSRIVPVLIMRAL